MARFVESTFMFNGYKSPPYEVPHNATVPLNEVRDIDL